MSLSENLREYISACFTGLWVQSHEHQDALTEIAQLSRDENWTLAVWDIDQGLQVPEQESPESAGGGDPLAAIRSIETVSVRKCSKTCFGELSPSAARRNWSENRVV